VPSNCTHLMHFKVGSELLCGDQSTGIHIFSLKPSQNRSFQYIRERCINLKREKWQENLTVKMSSFVF